MYFKKKNLMRKKTNSIVNSVIFRNKNKIVYIINLNFAFGIFISLKLNTTLIHTYNIRNRK